MSLKGWLLTGAFLLLLGADVLATLLCLIGYGAANDRRGANELLIALVVSWVSIIASLLWLKGPAILRLPLASGPLLIAIYSLAYTIIVEGNY